MVVYRAVKSKGGSHAVCFEPVSFLQPCLSQTEGQQDQGLRPSWSRREQGQGQAHETEGKGIVSVYEWLKEAVEGLLNTRTGLWLLLLLFSVLLVWLTFGNFEEEQ